MRVTRSVGSFALLALLLCSSVAAQGVAPPLARWTIYHISGVAQDTWSTWYAQGPFPIKVRFKCSKGTVSFDAVNTDTLTQRVSVRYWDIEPDQATLERAVQSRKALQNKGFVLLARQGITLPLYRPGQLCGSASNSFVFAAVYGT